MAKTREIVVSIHRSLGACCRRSLLDFAKQDRYMGAGEPGDRIRCHACQTWLVYDHRGWRAA